MKVSHCTQCVGVEAEGAERRRLQQQQLQMNEVGPYSTGSLVPGTGTW